jgi:hypothetical protein
MIFVRPRDGITLRMPDGTPLPAEGAEVEPGLFWDRRIADGDVLVGRPHPKKKEA